MTTPSRPAGNPAQAGGVVRRTRRNPLGCQALSRDGPAVSRELLSRETIGKPQLSRTGKVAGDLPDRDPLPPGEIAVRRSNGPRLQ